MKIRKATKKDIEECLKIARDLSEWFDDKSIETMGKELPRHPLYIYDDGEVSGFICFKDKSNDVVEIIHFAVTREEQRCGIGTKLLRFIENEFAKGKLIEVKTLDESCDYEPYVRTRAFYNKNGFSKVEVIDSYPGWEPGNPCAIYIKSIG